MASATQPTSGKTLATGAEDQRAIVERIAQSIALSRSPRLRELFLYIADRTLSNCLEDLTEIRIGENVFGRRNYNPSEDNIVRVSARQLRTKIAEFYHSERRPGDLEVEIPKGGYQAVFRSVPGLDVRDAEPMSASQSYTLASLRAHALPFARLSAGVAGVVLVLMVAMLWFENYRLSKENKELRSSLALPGSPSATLFEPFVAVPERRTEIVVSDSGLVLYESLLGRYVALDEYSSGRFPRLGADAKCHLEQARNRSRVFCAQPRSRVLVPSES